MVKVNYEYTLGNHVYKFAVILADNSVVPYQLTFERDWYVDRTNVTLLNFYQGDDNKHFCPDIRRTVVGVFSSFFGLFPEEKVYFEIDLSYKRNYLKLLKFLRWAAMHRKIYTLKVDMVVKDDLLYAFNHYNKNINRSMSGFFISFLFC